MSTAMPVCSVLVAAYNAEQYLAQCLDSLVGQTLADIEVVVVDDGSADHTLQIAQRYAQADARVKCLALMGNHGQAYARNQALGLASGRYICFLDADDWYAPDAIEQAVSVFSRYPDTDCVLFDVVMWRSADDWQLAQSEPFDCLTGYEAFRKSLTWQIHGVYMVRAGIHHRYPYDDTCRAYSDDNTTRIHYYIARRVRRCHGHYYYRQHAGSVTHQVSLRHFDYLRANESMRRQLMQLGVADDVLSEYENVRWLVLVDCYRFYYLHRREMGPWMRRRALAEMHRVWRGIEVGCLYARNHYKLGYMPLRCSWRLFCWQEQVYFGLKRWLHRL